MEDTNVYAHQVNTSDDLPKALCIPELLQKIFQYVLDESYDISEEGVAESFQTICPTWGGICREIITSKQWFFINPNQGDEVYLKEYLEQIHWTYRSFICWLMPSKISRIIFQKIGLQLKELQLRFDNSTTVENFEILLQIMARHCKKFGTLHILFAKKNIVPRGMFSSFKSGFLPIQTLIADDINNAKQMRFLQKIVEISPELRKIKLTTDEIPVVTGLLRTIINTPQTIKTLKEVLLPRPFLKSRSPLLINYFVYNNWKISSFQTCFGESMVLKHVQRLINSFSATLERLEIDFENCLEEFYEEEESEVAGFQDYLLVPLTLVKLKTLIVSHTPSRSLALINALLLPKLSTFEFQAWECDCDGNQSFKEVNDWVDTSLGNHHLKELNLKYVNDISIFTITPNPWKNLRSLEFSTESAEIVRAVFKNVVGLVKLHLFIVDKEQEPWMGILTGRRKPANGVGFRFDRPSIRNLEKLKSLKITGSRYSNLTFSDIFIFHGLLPLAELQYICLQSSNNQVFSYGNDFLFCSM